MTISELTENLKNLSLAHEDIRSFHIGETFDVATSKSSDKYPAVWLELPINTNYESRRKEHSTAIDVVNLAESDDIEDQIRVTSNMEAIADQLLQKIIEVYRQLGINIQSGLTLRNFSDDDLCGVRIDLTFIVGRECDFTDKFNYIPIA